MCLVWCGVGVDVDGGDAVSHPPRTAPRDCTPSVPAGFECESESESRAGSRLCVCDCELTTLGACSGWNVWNVHETSPWVSCVFGVLKKRKKKKNIVSVLFTTEAIYDQCLNATSRSTNTPCATQTYRPSTLSLSTTPHRHTLTHTTVTHTHILGSVSHI